MNIENIRNDFPEMPEEIRSMIAQTVAEQVKAGEPTKPIKRNKVRQTAILAFAAALVLGVTALAAGVARLHSQRVGSYGAAVTFTEETPSSVSASEESAVTFAAGAAENAGVWYDLTIEPGWLPEGMEDSGMGDWKYSFAETPYKGGFSLYSGVLDTGNAVFCELEQNVAEQEELEIAGHEAVFIQRIGMADQSASDPWFNKLFYVAYPEYNTVITLYAGTDITRDEAVRVLENLNITVKGTEERDLSFTEAIYLEAAAAVREGRAVRDVSDAYELAQANGGSFFDYMDIAQAINDMINRDDGPVKTVLKTDIAGIYQVGETFTAPYDYGKVNLPVRVTAVQIAEDTSILAHPERAYMNFTADENGRLGVNTVQFIKEGDGIDAPLAEIVAELPQQEKLVAVTLEITNDTDETLYDLGYSLAVLSVTETEDSFTLFEPTPAELVDYDYWENSDITDYGLMDYFDTVNDEVKNHIPELAPGETAELQIAFVVNECQVDKLLLSMSGDGSGTTFSDRDLAIGYVDLRG